MTANKIGVGVIGLRMGRQHLVGYRANPHTEIIGVCDIDPDRTAQIAKEFGARIAVTDYRRLLESPDIQLVSVASPDYYHAEHAVAAMEAGKDVLCEKPLTLNMEDARAIIDAVERTGRRFMIGQVCRFAPGFALARRMVERGDIGELYFVESEYAHNYSHARGVGDWRVDPRRHPFIGGGCHAVDLVRWIAGEVTEVHAFANHKCFRDWPVDDCTIAIFRFENDIIGKVMVSIGCVRPYTMRSVFYGTEGTIICDNTSPEIQLCSRAYLSGPPRFATFPVNVASHNVSAEIEEIVNAILDDTPIKTDVYEGAKTVAACVAAVESARTGNTIRPAELL